MILPCSWVHAWLVSFFFESVFEIKEKYHALVLHLLCVFVVFSSGAFLAANFTGSAVKSLNIPLSTQAVTFVLFCEWVLDAPHTGNSEVWKKLEQLTWQGCWWETPGETPGSGTASPLWCLSAARGRIPGMRAWTRACCFSIHPVNGTGQGLIYHNGIHDRRWWCGWKHSSIIIKAAKRDAEWCVGQSLVFLISGGWQRARHSLSMLSAAAPA